MGELLDNSELTLDLIHVLELIDNPSNYTKVLGMCIGLQQKLSRFREAVKLIPAAQKPFDAQAAAAAEHVLEQRIEHTTERVNYYRQRLSELKTVH